MTYRQARSLFLSFLGFLLLVSCAQPLTPPSIMKSKGSLWIYISGGSSTQRTIQPVANDLTITQYTISGSGPAGVTLAPLTQASGTFSAPSIDAGDWSITIQGRNAGNAVVASATTTLTVPAGGTVNKTVQLVAETGNGTLSLTVTWPAGTVVDTVYGTLKLDGGSAENISLVISGNSATLTASKPNGASTLVINLANAGQLLAPPMMEAVMIYKAMVSPGTIDFTSADLAGGGTVAAPSFSLAAGTYNNLSTLTLSTVTAGATIRYTTDGTLPTGTTGIIYTGPITIGTTCTVKAIACFSSWANSAVVTNTYVLQSATPNFSVAPGTYNNDQTVSVTSSTTGATIRYTTDGTTPTKSVGTIYSAPLVVASTQTVKALAYLTNFDDSAVSSSTYTLVAANPVPSFTAGTYDIGQSVTLSSTTTGSTFRYTTDGTTPSETTGTIYSGAIAVNTTSTLKTISYKAGYSNSAVVTLAYTILGIVGTPVISLASGTYSTGQSTTISTTTPGASIRYTTDGSTPISTTGTLYSGPVSIAATQNLKAIAYISGWPASVVALAAYTINGAMGLSIVGLPNVALSIQGVPSLLLRSKSMTALANPSTGLSSYNWYLDGTPIAGANTASFTLSSGSSRWLAKGPHSLTLIAKAGSSSYSSNARFTAYDGVLVSVGTQHTMILKTDGWLWASGYNLKGQLGNGTNTSVSTPVQVMTGVASVSAGSSHTMILKTDGSLWATGDNGSGQLGNGTTTSVSTPMQVMTGVASVSAGSGHTMIVKTDGSLWATGFNLHGALGNGTTTSVSTPVEVMTGVDSVSAGSGHTMIVKTDGSLWATGFNLKGQLGNGTNTDVFTPVQVMTGVASVYPGSTHTMILKTDGTLWATGDNGYGQLGTGDTTTVVTPVQVMTGVASVSAGDNIHTMILKNDGTLWATGNNMNGQLGTGNTTNVSTPVQVMTGVASVSAGGKSTMILKTDGTLWATGNNNFGQLGIGTTTNSSVPVRINSMNPY